MLPPEPVTGAHAVLQPQGGETGIGWRGLGQVGTVLGVGSVMAVGFVRLDWILALQIAGGVVALMAAVLRLGRDINGLGRSARQVDYSQQKQIDDLRRRLATLEQGSP